MPLTQKPILHVNSLLEMSVAYFLRKFSPFRLFVTQYKDLEIIGIKHHYLKILEKEGKKL